MFRDGVRIKTYRIALGRNPSGAKQQEGDMKTPEGLYKIDGRDPKSSFHLALHISYPSDEDDKRAAARGIPAGFDIMIHGVQNGRGWIGAFHRWKDWTAGCIAVTDEEIEEWRNEEGWARARRARFAKLIGRRAIQANDDYLAGKVEAVQRTRRAEDGPRPTQEEQVQRELQANFRIMEQVRERDSANAAGGVLEKRTPPKNALEFLRMHQLFPRDEFVQVEQHAADADESRRLQGIDQFWRRRHQRGRRRFVLCQNADLLIQQER